MSQKQKPKSDNAKFHIEFLNQAQKYAWSAFQQHDILFLIGPAGTGKSFLAMSFAINEILKKTKKKVFLTRPIVEAGESLGYLPGDFNEKVMPYMLPLYDSLNKLVGEHSPQRDAIDKVVEVAPLAYLRGRAQPLESMVLTPNGPKKMGDLIIGSYVIGSNGEPTKVLEIYPQGMQDVYKVSFQDGTFTECTKDHLWFTQTLNEKRHNKSGSVKTTEEIMQRVKTKFNQKYHKIPLVTNPVNFAEQKVSIDPYFLGLLLGDGCFRARLSFTTADLELKDYVEHAIAKYHNLKLRKCGEYDYAISMTKGLGFTTNELRDKLKILELDYLLSKDKYIPDCYKYNSAEVRLNLLKGLMDTDGWIGFHKTKSGRNRVQFYSTSEKLANDVIFLVQSLGGIAHKIKKPFKKDAGHLYKGHFIKHVNSIYVVEIVCQENIFNLSRKKDKFHGSQPKRLIADISYVGKKNCQCIRVDNEDGLYLTDSFIVTHNTFDSAIGILDEAQNCSIMQLKLFLTRMGSDSKLIITADPTQADIGNTGIREVLDKVSNIPGIATVYFKEESIVRHPLVAQIVKVI